MNVRSLRLWVFAWMWAALPAFGQPANTAPEPTIVVGGYSETEVPPTTASFTISVHTEGSSSAAASSDNARISKLVLDALRAASLTNAELTGSDLSVNPRWTYDESTRRRKRLGYEANNTFHIRTDRLDKLGAFIDVALGAEATGVSEVQFTAKDIVAARQRMLSAAVGEARRDAETLARANGGRLGRLVLVTAGNADGGMNEITVTATRRAAVATEIHPSQITVNARVTARWQFIPGAQE